MAAKQQVAVKGENQDIAPAFLRDTGKQKLGNIDSTDLIIPRIKLLQAISPELETHEHAKAGRFWHTLAEETMTGPDGENLPFIPIMIRKSYVLWAPRNDDRMVLARAVDGVHWDNKEVFKVKPKGAAGEVTWDTTKGTVAASGLDQFGTSIPGDPQSAPAASLTYEILAYFPDHPELSPSVILNTRSAVKKAKTLISKIEMRPVAHFGQIFNMSATKEAGAEGPYFGYAYTANGYVQSEDEFRRLHRLYEHFSQGAWRANDATDEDGGGAPSGGSYGGGKVSSKF
jgi:hypothetical protein